MAKVLNSPYSELTKRELRLVQNPNENRNEGYGGYYKWYTLSNTRKGNGGVTILGSRCRGRFWRDKPYQPRKK